MIWTDSMWTGILGGDVIVHFVAGENLTRNRVIWIDDL